MDNRPVSVRSVYSVRMFVSKMQMECREKKKSREEKKKYPCAPGRYISSQHNIFILLLLVIGEKSLYPHEHPWPLPSSSSDFASRWEVEAVSCPRMRQDSY